MTVRQYAEQMGLRLRLDTGAGAWWYWLQGVRLANSGGQPAAAEGRTSDEALAALATLISRRTLVDAVRATTLYWVPQLTG